MKMFHLRLKLKTLILMAEDGATLNSKLLIDKKPQ